MRKLIYTLVILAFACIANAQTGWFSLNSGTGRQLNGLYFINSNTGWVVGDSIVLKTTNSGLNWVVQMLPAETRNRSVHFINQYTGFIVGDKNYNSYTFGVYTYKTTNGGTNWFTVNYFFPGIIGTAYFNNVFAVNENIVYRTYGQYLAFSNSGAVQKSTDGGVTFSVSLASGDIRGISFINSQTGWISSFISSDVLPNIVYVYKTTNAGISWTQRDSVRWFNSSAIQFINESTGYALSYKSNTWIFKTTNSGLTWTRDSLNNNKFRGMHFVNSTTGWIVGYPLITGSNISRTTNGGLNWSDQFPQGTTGLNSVYFTDVLTGWAVGFYGIILKTTNGGVTYTKSLNNIVPENYILYQNYPNPFNPVTKISFEIAHDSRFHGNNNVLLVVFDILGKKIATLINEQLAPGTYTVDWNASEYPSGIYFYRMITDGFSETKKMILMK